MDTRQPRLERAEDAVQAILAAATQELLDEGLESVTHRRVATLANANLRSTTYYFKSVKALRHEALKLAFALGAKQREALISSLGKTKQKDLPLMLLWLTYGKDLDVNKLAVAQRNIIAASLDSTYEDLMRGVQQDVEQDIQKVLDHFGLTLSASKVIALIDGRIMEHILSGGKTDLQAKLGSDLEI